MDVLVATHRFGGRGSLAVVRSLGRAGARVTLGGVEWRGRAFHSRFLAGRLRYPDPCHDPEAFLSSLGEEMRRRPFEVILPIGDELTAALAAHRSALGDVACPVPDERALARAGDKWQTLELAREIGIETPETHAPADFAALEELSRTVRYPCVRKPRRGAGAVGVAYPRDAGELLRDLPDAPHLVQEYVPDEVHDVCALFCSGAPRALLTQRRLRMLPATGGPGIYNETTDEPGLRDRAVALLEGLGWHGPAQVEFRIDARSGAPKLMEVNGRFWGTLDLAIAAGIDFPLLASRLAREGDVAPSLDYVVGRRFRWTWPDGIQHALAAPRRVPALWEALRPERGTGSDLRLDDPWPHVAEGLQAMRSRWRGRGSPAVPSP